MLAVALSTLVAGGLLVVSTASPAAADDVRFEKNTSWAWTDSEHPKKINIDQVGDVSVGTWVDSKRRRHTSRAYFTFDITSYRGAVIELATFNAKETGAGDCAKRPEVELWRTEAYTSRSSWAKPPADLARIDTTALPAESGCPASYVGFDATQGLRQALAEGKSTLTLSLRLPVKVEKDPKLARKYASQVGLSIEHNYPPGVPTDLQTANGTNCTVAEPYQVLPFRTLDLSAVVHDKDRTDTGGTDEITATFALWPVDEPDARVERIDFSRDGQRALGRFRDFPSLFEHDRVYAWQVRAADSRATSEWSAVCYFRTDFEGPTTAPAVSSTDFPADGTPPPALSGRFTFDAEGATDVVGFVYQLNSGAPGRVTANQPGGSATVTLNPRSGPNSLDVWSVDALGNQSPVTNYRFSGAPTTPTISATVYQEFTESGGPGVPGVFTFTPVVPGTVSYRYSFNEQTGTVPANADGSASVTWVPTEAGWTMLEVVGVNQDGVETTAAIWFFGVAEQPAGS
ncbi:hypothetical protein AB0A95_08955 [Micromonospora sp. NPDC049230]|uniref:hypothetical protein n=1 Tax=Micromonospora sp. NPDC049230 TaxID=3155502 RepID=UPI0033DE6CA3